MDNIKKKKVCIIRVRGVKEKNKDLIDLKLPDLKKKKKSK